MGSRPDSGENFLILASSAIPWLTVDLAPGDGETNAPGVYVHRTANAKLVKTGQNWYYSLHA